MIEIYRKDFYYSTLQVVARYTYDAWGKILGISGDTVVAQLNPLRYRGYYYDRETGWYYLQSRYYDPEVGRFLNADNTIGANEDLLSGNLYAYCSNNPVNYSDPSGNSFILACIIAGIILGGTIGGVSAYYNGTDVFEGIIKGALIGAAAGAFIGAAGAAMFAGSFAATTAEVFAGMGTFGSLISTGGAAAGWDFISKNTSQAFSLFSQSIANLKHNPWKSMNDFNKGQPVGSIQRNVNPNTLIPTKILSTLDPQRIKNAWEYYGEQAIEVYRNGVIIEGHHRVAFAIMNELPVVVKVRLW
ncbi:MAG TPA: hypothetical protein DCP51_02245 [Clostridiales bacterium]|nr:hypothetical protein [Clostridiales bacterium]